MRIGSFIAGGMVGAALVYMMNSRVRSRLMSTMGLMNSANPQQMWKGDSHKNQSQNTSHSSRDHSSDELEGFKKVKQLISQDPELRQTIREIVGQSASGTASASVPKH